MAIVVGALAMTLVGAPPADAAKKDPRLTRSVFVDPHGAGAKAAKKNPKLKRIGSRGQAFWVTDAYSTKTVKGKVAAYAKRATKAKRTPLVAIYAVPGRDCGHHSAGGLTHRQYRAWIAQVAAGLKGRKAIAVLEPDAIAQMDSCPGQGDRAGLLRHAVKKLKAAGVWVYLDAGHSNWRSPSVIAQRLAASGVKDARGFATNVANFRPTEDEVTYAGQVLAGLRDLGITKRRYVIDTSRNGAKRPPTAGDFCNPRPARIGRKPAIVNTKSLDAYLWVKRPGESDGPCNGGPRAGAWWRTGALRLLG